MRIKELNEGVISSFKKGWNAAAPKGASAPSTTNKKSSPFDMLSPRDAKDILYNVINGNKLDSGHLYKLQQIYNKL
jgi:hypothetical protein